MFTKRSFDKCFLYKAKLGSSSFLSSISKMQKVVSIILLSCAVYRAFALIEEEESSGQHHCWFSRGGTHFDFTENIEKHVGLLCRKY